MIGDRRLTRSELTTKAEVFIRLNLDAMRIAFGLGDAPRIFGRLGIEAFASPPPCLSEIFNHINGLDPTPSHDGESFLTRAHFARDSWLFTEGANYKVFLKRNPDFERCLERGYADFCWRLEERYPKPLLSEIAYAHVSGEPPPDDGIRKYLGDEDGHVPCLLFGTDLGFSGRDWNAEHRTLVFLLESLKTAVIVPAYLEFREQAASWKKEAIWRAMEQMRKEDSVGTVLQCNIQYTMAVISLLVYWWRTEGAELAGVRTEMPAAVAELEAFAQQVTPEETRRIRARGNDIYLERIRANHANPQLKFSSRDEHYAGVMHWLDLSRPTEQSPLGECFHAVKLDPFDCHWDAVMEAPDGIKNRYSGERLRVVLQELCAWARRALESPDPEPLACPGWQGRESRLGDLAARCNQVWAMAGLATSHQDQPSPPDLPNPAASQIADLSQAINSLAINVGMAPLKQRKAPRSEPKPNGRPKGSISIPRADRLEDIRLYDGWQKGNFLTKSAYAQSLGLPTKIVEARINRERMGRQRGHNTNLDEE